MFLLIGAGPHVKEISDSQMMICPSCGRFSRMTPYAKRQELRLFFIPVFKWKTRYFTVADCCGENFLLDPEIGHALTKGHPVTIDESDLTLINPSRVLCEHCKKPVEAHHTYCPHCGKER